MNEPEGSARRAEIREVKAAVEDDLLARPEINGVDIGEKITGGNPTGTLAIIVYVQEKKAPEELEDSEVIPPLIDGIPTDVVEERVVPHPAFAEVAAAVPEIDAAKYPTLLGGISMGPCRSIHLEPPDVPAAGNYVFTGTLGAMVLDRSTKARMALTNFHVACVDAGWSAGDTMTQPSRVDGGSCPADVFGTLARAALSTHIDGAVVGIDAGAATDCAIQDIGAVAGQAAASVGLTVRKRGRTTGLTHGTVVSVDASVSIDYGDGLGVRILKNQIRVEVDTTKSAKFSDHGDSGSVVVTGDRKVVGLLFAGNDVPGNPALSGTVAFANPIQFVLDELDVDLCVPPVLPIRTKSFDPRCTVFVTTRVIPCEPVISYAVPCTLPRTVRCFDNPIDIPRPPDFGPPGVLSAIYGVPGAHSAFWQGYYAALDAVARELGESDPPQ